MAEITKETVGLLWLARRKVLRRDSLLLSNEMEAVVVEVGLLSNCREEVLYMEEAPGMEAILCWRLVRFCFAWPLDVVSMSCIRREEVAKVEEAARR